jgi:hypothetical protein
MDCPIPASTINAKRKNHFRKLKEKKVQSLILDYCIRNTPKKLKGETCES